MPVYRFHSTCTVYCIVTHMHVHVVVVIQLAELTSHMYHTDVIVIVYTCTYRPDCIGQ